MTIQGNELLLLAIVILIMGIFLMLNEGGGGEQQAAEPPAPPEPQEEAQGETDPFRSAQETPSQASSSSDATQDPFQAPKS